MAEMPLVLCGSVSRTHIRAEISWPVILVVRDSSFRWEELVLKREEGLFLQCRVERGAAVGPSKAQGQKLRLTSARTHAQNHMQPYERMPRLHTHKDTDGMHTFGNSSAQINLHKSICYMNHRLHTAQKAPGKSPQT